MECCGARPVERNGLGFSQDDVREVASIESLLTLLPDSVSVYAEWKRIVEVHKVQGVKVYDARLVAVAKVYGVASILTFNSGDFSRYTSLKALHPSALLMR